MEIAGTQLVEYSFARILKYKTDVGMGPVILILSLFDLFKRPRTPAIFAEPDFNEAVEKINVCLLEVGNLKDDRKALG